MSAGAARDELGQALGYEQDETTKVWWGQCRDCGGWKASVGLTSYSCETCGAMTHKQASLKFGGPTTSSVLKLVQGGPGRTVPAPAAPMPVARELVKDLYTESVGLVLRYHRGDFYRYEGKCWPEMDRDSLRADAYRWLEDAVYEKEVKGDIVQEGWNPTRNKIDNVIDALRAVVMLPDGEPPLWSDGDGPPADEMISMSNGLLHVPTRELHEHTPDYFTHHALPFAFEPGAADPGNWLAFLDQLWPGDAAAVSALQEVFGYILGGDTRQQKIFLLVGPRRGGKGTIGRVLTGLLGRHNVAAPTMASLSTNFGLQPLIGCPLGLISDARLSGRGDGSVVVERLLSVSGEDSITIDRKFRDPWTGRLPTRFVILTNELPRLTDSSGALASRFIVFVLTQSFLNKEDPGLTERLLAEAPGIFNWALRGLDRMNERGYFELPQSGKDAVQQLEDLSSLLTHRAAVLGRPAALWTPLVTGSALHVSLLGSCPVSQGGSSRVPAVL